MAIVKPVRDNIITFVYTPEKEDEFSCAWARFKLDLERYSMSIESDCGNYCYTGWTPTPKTESFLKLCQRFNKEYLLEKFSNRSVLNHSITYQNVKDFLRINDLYFDIDTEIIKEFHQALKDGILHGPSDERELVNGIEYIINDYGLRGEFTDYDIWDCIEKDFPIGIQTILHIYFKYIVPAIAEYEAKKE